MGLFNKLRRLYRTNRFELEDFHTEIVAQVLKNSPELTMRWLRGIEAANPQMSAVTSIKTQEEFAALEQDQPGSRVDMVIQLSGNGVHQIVFIESKIGSTENPGQLAKYESIAKQLGFDYNAIVYITRDFEVPRPDLPDVKMTRWS